jgi:hypothetical protein
MATASTSPPASRAVAGRPRTAEISRPTATPKASAHVVLNAIGTRGTPYGDEGVLQGALDEFGTAVTPTDPEREPTGVVLVEPAQRLLVTCGDRRSGAEWSSRATGP